ncbi:hypothetical protein [Microbacterium tumbae]
MTGVAAVRVTGVTPVAAIRVRGTGVVVVIVTRVLVVAVRCGIRVVVVERAVVRFMPVVVVVVMRVRRVRVAVRIMTRMFAMGRVAIGGRVVVMHVRIAHQILLVASITFVQNTPRGYSFRTTVHPSIFPLLTPFNASIQEETPGSRGSSAISLDLDADS